jgi:hypothetical protein
MLKKKYILVVCLLFWVQDTDEGFGLLEWIGVNPLLEPR